MLGFEVSEAAVSKYMPRHPKPPSQTWRTFLENHVGCLASTDFFVVPTATFSLLFALVVLRHERRRIVHIGTTAHPTAAWVAQQIREAFPWETAPRYMIRDRDRVYGIAFRSRIKAMGIEEVVTAPRSPWQSPYVERVIGSLCVLAGPLDVLLGLGSGAGDVGKGLVQHSDVPQQLVAVHAAKGAFAEHLPSPPPSFAFLQ